MHEWLDEDYHLDTISAEKRSVLYIQETAFREAIPFFMVFSNPSNPRP